MKSRDIKVADEWESRDNEALTELETTLPVSAQRRWDRFFRSRIQLCESLAELEYVRHRFWRVGDEDGAFASRVVKLSLMFAEANNSTELDRAFDYGRSLLADAPDPSGAIMIRDQLHRCLAAVVHARIADGERILRATPGLRPDRIDEYITLLEGLHVAVQREVSAGSVLHSQLSSALERMIKIARERLPPRSFVVAKQRAEEALLLRLARAPRGTIWLGLLLLAYGAVGVVKSVLQFLE
jgi:hypothetical protein